MSAVLETGGDVAKALMVEAGVVRLADLTGLDCIGVPVWQSIRPWSRALSVHQGKGLTAAAAQLGAIMEAVESHHAETWSADVRKDRPLPDRTNSWAELPVAYRAPDVNDFAVQRGALAPDCCLDWVAVEGLANSTSFYVPAACISLDCTRVPKLPLSISSNGQSAHFSLQEATFRALMEIVERDAVSQWLARSPLSRQGSEINPAAIDSSYVQALFSKLAARSIHVRLFLIGAAIPVPVMVAELSSAGTKTLFHHVTWGSAAATSHSEAALAAMLEAAQSRCTEIAGARDTIPIAHARRSSGQKRASLAMPRPTGHPERQLRDMAEVPYHFEDIAFAFERAGFRQVGRMVISPPDSLATTVKAFVPGLGFDSRRRRAA